jgi:plasmid stability protein
MASIIVRKLDDKVKQQLRQQAAEHGRSLEAEVREILSDSVCHSMRPGDNLFDSIRRRFAPLGGVELKIPKRGPMRKPPDFTK